MNKLTLSMISGFCIQYVNKLITFSKRVWAGYRELPRSTQWAIPSAFVVGLIANSAFLSFSEKMKLASEAAKATAKMNKAVPVAVYNVETRSIANQFYTHSYIQPKKEITLRPNSNVTVRQVRVEVGQLIKRGDTLAYTDSEAQAIRAELDGIELQLKNLDYSVTVALAKKSFISSKEFQQKELEHKASRLRGKLAKIETTGAILSPINGIVSEISLKSGDYIDNPSQYFIKIADASSFRLQLFLPQTVASKLKKGADAILTRTKTDEFGKDNFEVTFGRVSAIAPLVDPKSGSVLTEVEVDKVPPGWIAGQYVQVTMTLDQADQVVAVPNESIIYENSQPYVYRVSHAGEGDQTKDGAGDNVTSGEIRKPASQENQTVVLKTKIQTGLRDAKFTEVREGIQAADKVVIEGQGALANNAVVEIVR